MGYADYKTAFSTDHYLFKIEKIDDDTDPAADGKYLIYCVNEDGSNYSNNSFQTNADECFIYALTFGSGRGLHCTNSAVWDIEYVDDGVHIGWTLKNIGLNGYYNDPTKAADNVNPETYFTFCEVISTDPTITISNAESIAQTLVNNPESFVEIPQRQDNDTGANLAEFTESDGVTTYTSPGDIGVLFKMLSVDVSGCDFITFKFDDPVPSGLNYSFWAGTKSASLPTSTELKYIFAEDAECEISNGIIPQVAVVSLWSSGKVLKVKGIYKHTAIDCSRTYSFNEALDFTGTGLEAYVITAFDAEKGTLTLSRVYQVPANTGLYLVGKGGNYKIPTIDSASPIATNLLKASADEELAVTSGDNTNLIFGGTGEDRGFHKLAASGNIGENKAYLQLSTTELEAFLASGARLSLVFEDEATAITKVNEVKAENDAWYTISGMKLNAKPTQRGIYIKNGKKFAIQ